MGRRSLKPPISVANFEPPFCPNPACAQHLVEPGTTWPWQGRGLRQVRRRPYWVRQFRCGACGRWFRSSVFADDYWKKLPQLNGRIYHLLLNGCSMRQAARVLNRGATTVRWRVRLMARQCLLIHLEQLLQLLARLDEPLVYDGQRTFADSKYEMLDLQVAITAATRFALVQNVAPLRRSGRMTEQQREIRGQRDAELGRPDADVRFETTRLNLQRLAPLFVKGKRIALFTDEEPSCARAVAAVGKKRFQHTTVSSRAPRVPGNPLTPINRFNAYARHAERPLVRKTIAFAKRAIGLLDRSWIHLVGNNNTKGISERRADTAHVTPAMKLGLHEKPLRGKALFSRRRFPRRIGLPEDLVSAYEGTFKARPHEKVVPHPYKFVA